jgi:hypothetical protein
VPSVLPDLLKGDEDEKSDAALQAMLKMAKLDIETLRAAYDRS